MKKYLLQIGFVFFVNMLYPQKIFTIKDDGVVITHTSSDVKRHKDRCVDGICIDIDSINNIKSEARFKNCKLNGLFRLYFNNGLIKEFGNYQDGQKIGKWYYWKENGELIKTENFPDKPDKVLFHR